MFLKIMQSSQIPSAPALQPIAKHGSGGRATTGASTVQASTAERAGFAQLARYGRILLLQGPNGPFFARLRDWLQAAGCRVWKVNFNGGDDLFYRTGSILHFGGKMKEWRPYLNDLLIRERIEAIVVFGDCRRLHRIAAQVAPPLGIAFWAFEEGYVRPDYITLEAGGVNANSPLIGLSLDDMPAFAPPRKQHTFRHAFGKMAWYSFWYFAAGLAGADRYPHYRHHKPFGTRELGCWLRAACRKTVYGWREQTLVRSLLSPEHPPFFLVALQVHCDSQIRSHSPWRRVEDFIEWTIFSFSRHARPDHVLVIKHHPMDRGHTNYAEIIRRCAARFDVTQRVSYLHDAHLPSLLQRCEGLVTINSTVGLQALFHAVPIIALGRCLYAKRGATFQGALDAFWTDQGSFDNAASIRLRHYLTHVSQINASFYARAVPIPARKEIRNFSSVTWRRRIVCIVSLAALDLLNCNLINASGAMRRVLGLLDGG